MNHKLFFLFIIIIAAAAGAAATFHFQTDAVTGPAAHAAADCGDEPACADETAGATPADTDDHLHDTHESEHCHDEVSDLDRSVEEMWTETCEHDILHYTCDECRYELGIVKVSGSVMAGGKEPGIIAITQAAAMNFSTPLMLTGDVQVNETRTVRIASPIQGVIRDIPADTGRRFATGDMLFQLDSDEAAAAKAEYMKTAAAADLARKTARREADLFTKNISAEAEVQEAEHRLAEAEIELQNAGLRLERLGVSRQEINRMAGGNPGGIHGLLTVTAPIAGTVIEKYASAGERVEAGKEILLLSDLSEVWVWANIREGDLALLQPHADDLTCDIETPGLPGQTFSGKLDVISGQMNAETRTVKARFRVANREGRLKPGMFVNVRVMLPARDSVVAVPEIAVLADAGQSFVFVHKEGEYWVRRPVTTGDTFREFVEIKEGLSLGQTVIADGAFLLKSDVLREKMGAGCAD